MNLWLSCCSLQLMFWLTFSWFSRIFMLFSLHELWRTTSKITKHTSQLQSVWCRITKRWIYFEVNVQCVFYRNHYSFSDTYQLHYTEALTGNLNLSLLSDFYISLILWMQEFVVFYELLFIKVTFGMFLMQKKVLHQITKRKVSMALVPFIMKAYIWHFRSSVDNYFLTFSLKNMCWDYTVSSDPIAFLSSE